MTLKAEIFKSSSKSWQVLCDEVSAFASRMGRERIQNISMAAAGGQDLFGIGAAGVIVVWYWE